MTGFIINASYGPKIDERREQRIHDALERCGVQIGYSLPGTMDGKEIQMVFSEVDWNSNRDGSANELEIYVDDPLRATRLASELRACGMVVHVDDRRHGGDA